MRGEVSFGFQGHFCGKVHFGSRAILREGLLWVQGHLCGKVHFDFRATFEARSVVASGPLLLEVPLWV